jgi:hypothetical protein
MMPPGRFFRSRFNGMFGKAFLTLGGKAAFVIYKHKQKYFLQILGERSPRYGYPELYEIETKLYHETYQRYLKLKYSVPGSEKVARNFTRSPEFKVFLKAPWKCPNQILCSYLAAIR